MFKGEIFKAMGEVIIDREHEAVNSSRGVDTLQDHFLDNVKRIVK